MDGIRGIYGIAGRDLRMGLDYGLRRVAYNGGVGLPNAAGTRGVMMLIQSLHLKNILSFRDVELELEPLNVLIGPNGSGKSNLVDVIALLRAAPDDVAGFLRRNGPTGDWVWQGPERQETAFQTAQVSAVMQPPGVSLKYQLQAVVRNDRVHSLDERMDHVAPVPGKPGEYALTKPVFQSSNREGTIWPIRPGGIAPSYGDDTEKIDLLPGKSVLSVVSHPVNYPALTVTASRLADIKIYRSWSIGRDSAVRRPQPTDGPVDFLEEDFSNLALVVNELQGRRLQPSLDEYLQQFYESYESLRTRVYGNTIQLAVNERGMSGSLPATRLSDGTIRFIALLAILCHPEPPPLICIEEPEIAMHPDALMLIRDLLLAASERTQLIVTTHSTELVNWFSPEPDVVVVCDSDAATGTRFHRMTREKLTDWQSTYKQRGNELVVYKLREMWMSGSLGGVR